ncbi:hypothetical protein CUZ56_01191 [Saezia sanguinis]|uniref:Lipoprotein n=1 Tax=Saezia sanguinis TaxID=1965230 RepID=A0A433SET3_9BURK|nr:hypothetical protein [Saezia sanguinis]RUS67248.1 hypothetical protein CUZ56_01191 [Saezia sanguinis]
MKTFKFLQIRLIVLLTVMVALSSCSSNTDKLKTYLRCGIVASQLERGEASRRITEKFAIFARENNINPSARDLAFLSQEVRDEMDMYNKSMEGQLYTLVKIYNSSACMALHEQEKISPLPLQYYLIYFFL